MIKKTTALAVTAIAATLPSSAMAQQVPAAVVAVVDTSRIVETCTACVAANAALQAQATALQSRAQVLGAPLETEQTAIQQAIQAAGGNPDAALQARVQAFRTRQQSAQQELQTQQTTVQRNVAHVREQILTALSPIVQQQMQARGANIAIDAGSTFARSPTVEITNTVLAALNAALPSVSAIAPPAPTPPAAAATEGR